MGSGTSILSGLAHLLRPGASQVFNRVWHKRWMNRPPIAWEIQACYPTDEILFRFDGSPILVLVTRFEIDDGSYRHVAMPRLEHWLRKHLPRPHVRYVAKEFIKRQFRRPSVRID